MTERLPADDLAAGIVAGDRQALARGITLVESRRPVDHDQAQELLARVLVRTGEAQRVGISGMPGVGKSTFIDAFGMNLLDSGHRVAVLAVDPSSTVSGGSILGDKTRMARLSRDDRAFIRPSPSARTLGGVGRRTREAMLLCEAAGFDVVLVETVGVGQSETVVADMVDFFLVLALPGAGDELQGIKKGIIELADLVAVNKADGDNLPRAREAVAEYSAALRYARTPVDGWQPRAVMVSALTGEGLDHIWELIQKHRREVLGDEGLRTRRNAQMLRWMWSRIEERLLTDFRDAAQASGALAEAERAVAAGEMTPSSAAERLLDHHRRRD